MNLCAEVTCTICDSHSATAQGTFLLNCPWLFQQIFFVHWTTDRTKVLTVLAASGHPLAQTQAKLKHIKG
jgi:hypothetical protein